MIALLWLQLSTIISPLVSSPLLLLVYLANYPYEQEGPPKRVRTCSWFNPVKKKPFLATVVCLGVMFLWRSQVSLRCWNILFPTLIQLLLALSQAASFQPWWDVAIGLPPGVTFVKGAFTIKPVLWGLNVPIRNNQDTVALVWSQLNFRSTFNLFSWTEIIFFCCAQIESLHFMPS